MTFHLHSNRPGVFTRLVGGAAVLMVSAGLAQTALGQEAPAAAQPATAGSTGDPTMDNFIRLSRGVTIKFDQQRLEDVMKYLTDYTGADFEVLWRDDQHSDGLDPEQTLTLDVKGVSSLTLLEKVLEKAQTEDDENTWQVSKYGTIQVGPKSRLNKFKRTEIYDINDLLVDLPRYDEVPNIDLQSVLQSGQGGSGQSPFEENESQNDTERKTMKEKADEVVTLIQKIVEPQQWVDNGGEAGTIDQFRGTLIVTAPDYMHRQINGYPWWPGDRTSARMTNGRRYVSLNVDTGISTVDGFTNQPVTAVVNGQLIPSGPGGGR
jgi:hypothetical protein